MKNSRNYVLIILVLLSFKVFGQTHANKWIPLKDKSNDYDYHIRADSAKIVIDNYPYEKDSFLYVLEIKNNTPGCKHLMLEISWMQDKEIIKENHNIYLKAKTETENESYKRYCYISLKASNPTVKLLSEEDSEKCK